MSAGTSFTEVRAFLRSTLAARRAGPERLVVLLPGPATPPRGLGPTGRPPTVLFASAEGTTITGWDTAALIARDDHDLDAVRSEALRLHECTAIIAHPDLPDRARRPLAWVGGQSFASSAYTDSAWAAFPPTCFILPRWTYRAADGVTTLALALAPDEVVDVAGVTDEYASLVGCGPAVARRLRPRATLLPARNDDPQRWMTGARAALAAIARGRMHKVVLARHLDLTVLGGDPLDVSGALDDLARRFPTCTRFLLARHDADFFGATPETLVERTGDRLRSEAVAGSCRRGEEARLASSPKEAREHALVLEDVLARLRPFCDALEAPGVPSIRPLANVAHLWTPIRGRLARPTHVLDLVAHLHPTPSVAGTPTDAAVSFLGGAESVTRGWFAGPFGWFDVSGDGHFVVALRSCIRHEDGVRLYAGAGIVRGSDPASELDETELKMRALLDTLHAVTNEPADRVG